MESILWGKTSNFKIYNIMPDSDKCTKDDKVRRYCHHFLIAWSGKAFQES